MIVYVGLVDPLFFCFTKDSAHKVYATAKDLKAGIVFDLSHEILLTFETYSLQFMATVLDFLGGAIELKDLIQCLARVFSAQNHNLLAMRLRKNDRRLTWLKLRTAHLY